MDGYHKEEPMFNILIFKFSIRKILCKTLLLKSKGGGVFNSLINKLSLQNAGYYRHCSHMSTERF